MRVKVKLNISLLIKAILHCKDKHEIKKGANIADPKEAVL